VSTSLLFVLVGEALFYFLSLCVTALIAALCAVLAGNALAGDGRRIRLWSVVGLGEAAAVVAALGNLPFAGSSVSSQIGLGRQMLISAAGIAVVCGVAAWGLSRPSGVSHSGAQDARSVALLVALALLLLVSGMVIDGMSGPAA
jgi:hypothetical protein